MSAQPTVECSVANLRCDSVGQYIVDPYEVITDKLNAHDCNMMLGTDSAFLTSSMLTLNETGHEAASSKKNDALDGKYNSKSLVKDVAGIVFTRDDEIPNKLATKTEIPAVSLENLYKNFKKIL